MVIFLFMHGIWKWGLHMWNILLCLFGSAIFTRVNDMGFSCSWGFHILLKIHEDLRYETSRREVIICMRMMNGYWGPTIVLIHFLDIFTYFSKSVRILRYETKCLVFISWIKNFNGSNYNFGAYEIAKNRWWLMVFDPTTHCRQ